MKKQVVAIHGGRTFATYQEYLHSLKTRPIASDKFKVQNDWRCSLQENLGADFEVFVPKMPNGNNAVYEEWKIWFERLAEFLHDDVILVGHSLGGIFLAKYLSENTFTRKIKSVILLAAPFDEGGLQESLGHFILPESLENISAQTTSIYLIFSKDDPIVPFENAQKYQQALPGSHIMAFEDHQHFNQESFPELVELIKKSATIDKLS